MTSQREESPRIAATGNSPASAAMGLETVPEGEAGTIEEFKKFYIEDMKQKADGVPKERGQHPKPHGFVVAKFTVLEGLPDELRIGLFREPQLGAAAFGTGVSE